jgi:hypothetical protein
MLIRGGLFAEPSSDFVALGDDFNITGTAPGRDRVDILTINPKGGSGRGLDPNAISKVTNNTLDAPGLTYSTCGVDTTGTFTAEKIDVGEDVDTGTYLIAVLNYGRDGRWGKRGNDNLLAAISNDYNISLAVKTTDQILAILKEETINAPGSDDLLSIATLSVENGFVTLDDIEGVRLGSDLEVKGITNRKVDTPIMVTVEGVEEGMPDLKPKFATVEEGTARYNKFSVSFDTASARIGKYVVTADDGDRHVDTTTVDILLAVEPSVNVSATPVTQGQGTNESGSATATVTPKPTPTPTPEEPGFGTIFSIAGLLVVAWLMLKARRQKRR